MRTLCLCMVFLWNSLGFAASVDATFHSPRDMTVPSGIQTQSISIKVYHLQNFSSLLGQSPFPKKGHQGTFKLFLPPKHVRGVVVISPDLEGLRDQLMGRHVRHFLCMGYAVALVDSYGMRGLQNQGLITLPEQVMDMMLAIQYLQKQARFKGLPIGVFGSSRGGMVVNMLLDERVFKAFHVDFIQWACVLYPEVQIIYEENGIQPLKIPHLMIISQKDDSQSPKLSIDIAEVFHSKNPKLKQMLWLDAVHYMDAPFAKTWSPKARSMLKVPQVYVHEKGQYFYKKNYFESWNDVVAFWQPYITMGAHLGNVNDSDTKVMTVIEEFINVVDGR